MAEDNFNQQIIDATTEREKWYDETELPKIQEAYRLHLSCFKNIFDNLVKHSLVVPDPYQTDNKINQISVPETKEFPDNEKSIVMGVRLCSYETMIDFVCNFMKFSVSSLNMRTIKTLLELNQTFNWTNLSVNSSKPNTRTLAIMLNDLRSTITQQIALSLLKDSLAKSHDAMAEINSGLKALADFKREAYKAEVRKTILLNPDFNKEKAYSSASAFASEVKRLFQSCMGKKAFSPELVGEIAEEETSSKKDELRKTLLGKVKLKEKKEEKKPEVDVHAVLLESLRILGTSAEQFKTIAEKVEANHEVLESEKKSFKDKFMRFMRSMLGLEEPDVDYEVLLVDKKTDAKRKETIHYKEFSENLSKKWRIYTSFAIKTGAGYIKMAAQSDQAIFSYLTKQAGDNAHLFTQLIALDEFFKRTAKPGDRSKIKGVSMELTTIKNIVLKSNQYKAEYASYVEEQEQMKRLGLA